MDPFLSRIKLVRHESQINMLLSDLLGINYTKKDAVVAEA